MCEEHQAVNAVATPSDQGAPESAQSLSSSPAIAPSERTAAAAVRALESAALDEPAAMLRIADDMERKGEGFCEAQWLRGVAHRLLGTHSAGSGETAPAWQPIETAPKDTALLLYVGGWRFDLGHYNTRYQAWLRGWDHSKIDEPTHWMPLPAPPSGGE